MFMRYRGGGIGHAMNQAQLSEEDAMEVDEDDADRDMENAHVEQDLEVSDEHLVEELLRIANKGTLGPILTNVREEVERTVVIDSDADDSEDERDSATAVMRNEDEDLGPEDGENEDYVDTGYGAL